MTVSEEGRPILFEDLDSHSVYPLIWFPPGGRAIRLFAMPDSTVRWEYVS